MAGEMGTPLENYKTKYLGKGPEFRLTGKMKCHREGFPEDETSDGARKHKWGLVQWKPVCALGATGATGSGMLSSKVEGGEESQAKFCRVPRWGWVSAGGAAVKAELTTTGRRVRSRPGGCCWFLAEILSCAMSLGIRAARER